MLSPPRSCPGRWADIFKHSGAKYDIGELTGRPAGDKGGIDAFFTSKGGTLYVITPRRLGKEPVVRDVEISPKTDVTMLDLAQSIPWGRSGFDLTIRTPALSVDGVP